MKYESDAIKATDAGLSPASVQDTCQHWQALGVTRQTEWRWRADPSTVPPMARLATAWLMHTGAKSVADDGLTKMVVLAAVVAAVRPRTVYINNEIQRWHTIRVRNGGTGHPPRGSLVARRLNALVKDGLLTRSQFSDGLYGYTWTITDAGRAALEGRNDG